MIVIQEKKDRFYGVKSSDTYPLRRLMRLSSTTATQEVPTYLAVAQK